MFGKKRSAVLVPGTKAPSFELPNVNGSSQSANAILGAGPAVFVFFKTGCPVCQMTMPFLERLTGQSGLQIFAISQDDRTSTQKFNDRFGITFPTLLDEAKAGYPVSSAFGITSVPSIFVVEPDGIISTAFAGFSKRELQALGDRIGRRPFQPDEKVPEFRAG
ncbi:MAG: peroxiredoxin family protein [Acidobacteriota bacterium]|nr:peroxiredoxin family protein [Acidobacteriota bacterium]